MNWLAFSYSLPGASRSSPRVAVWRRLRRIGAISPGGGVHILPVREECLEAFQWLSQEVKQAGGEALLMHVDRFNGMDDGRLIALFRQARKPDYELLEAGAAGLARSLRVKHRREGDRTATRELLAKLLRTYADIARIDFFEAPERERVALKLARIEDSLAPRPAATRVTPAPVSAYRRKRWITRPQTHIDRLACVWLIRRFIDPRAVIRYAHTPKAGEVSFDMPNGQFRHQGHLCTFETMVRAFGVNDPAVRTVAEIVHEIDLRDGRYVRPEVPGIDAILHGWKGLTDVERESHGVAVFEGLYAALRQGARRDMNRRRRARAKKR